MCGIFGIFGAPDAARTTYLGLFALQHRGEDSAGIAVSDGEHIEVIRRPGELCEGIHMSEAEALTGHIAVGHVRYATTGSQRMENIQPLVFSCRDGVVAIAHNGNLTNVRELRRGFEERGSIFQTSTDSEVIVHILAQPDVRTAAHPLSICLQRIAGSFSLVMMKKDRLIAVRDCNGFRPLILGRLEDAYVVASETTAFNLIGATIEREIEPGEILTITENGPESEHFSSPYGNRLARCIFEHVYFARPDSYVFGLNVHQARLRLGERLAEEHPADADLVIAVPDSGNSAALGYARKSGLPFDFGIIRNHYVGRTFIMPESQDRASTADLKLAVNHDVVENKRVVVVDDSIVRGNTFRNRAQQLRKAGAAEIHLRISCPPHRFPCFYGIAFPTHTELLANRVPLDQIAEHLGVDSVGYLSCENMVDAIDGNRNGWCTACFTGDYPVQPEPEAMDALAFEHDAPIKIS